MNYKKLVAAVCCLLVLVSLGIYFSRLLHAGFMVTDDMWMDLTAARMRVHGLRPYLDVAGDLASTQGRVYFYISTFFFVLPHLPSSETIQTAVVLGIHLIAVLAMAGFLGFYIGGLGSALFAGMVFCTLPFWWGYYPVNGLQGYYQVPVACFFGALICYVKLHRSDLEYARRVRLGLSCCLLLLAAMVFYEALYAPFLLILGAVVWAETPVEQRRLGALIRRSAPLLAVVGFWFGIYLMYRKAHPITYEGATLQTAGVLVPLLRHLWYYGIRSLPGANVLPFANPLSRAFLPFIVANAGRGAFIQAALLIVLVVIAGKAAATGKDACATLRVAGIAVLSGLIVPLPLALSAKYRDVPHLWAPYIPGYFVFLAYAAALTGILVWLLQGRSHLLFRRAAVLGIAVLAAVATLATAVANDTVSRRQKDVGEKWVLANLMAGPDLLGRLPAGATVAAPGLWAGLDKTWSAYDTYWDEYLNARLPRRINFTRDAGTVSDAVRGGKPAYYLEELPKPGEHATGAMLLTEIRGTGRDGSLKGESSFLVSDWEWRALDLAYTSQEDGSVARVRVPFPRRDQGGFEAMVATPGIVFGQAPLQDPVLLAVGKTSLRLLFQHGFSGLETAGSKYWRWNDGADKEVQLDLLNLSGKPLLAHFRTAINLPPPARSKFIVRIQGREESLQIAGHYDLDRALTLRAGSNEVDIKSFAPRVNAPGDPRYLVFSLENWDLAECDAACAAAYGTK